MTNGTRKCMRQTSCSTWPWRLQPARWCRGVTLSLNTRPRPGPGPHRPCATSWPCMGVRLATSDQCRYGLKSPSGRPIRKRAWFLTNCSFVFEEFDGKRCNCTQRHQHVIGSDLGAKLSAWAAHYPPALCRALSLCVRRRRFQRQAAALRGQSRGRPRGWPWPPLWLAVAAHAVLVLNT